MNLFGWLNRQKRWSLGAFGDTPRTEGILRHIEQELAEVRAAPSDLEEWCDIVDTGTGRCVACWAHPGSHLRHATGKAGNEHATRLDTGANRRRPRVPCDCVASPHKRDGPRQ